MCFISSSLRWRFLLFQRMYGAQFKKRTQAQMPRQKFLYKVLNYRVEEIVTPVVVTSMKILREPVQSATLLNLESDLPLIWQVTAWFLLVGRHSKQVLRCGNAIRCCCIRHSIDVAIASGSSQYLPPHRSFRECAIATRSFIREASSQFHRGCCRIYSVTCILF